MKLPHLFSIVIVILVAGSIILIHYIIAVPSLSTIPSPATPQSQMRPKSDVFITPGKQPEYEQQR